MGLTSATRSSRRELERAVQNQENQVARRSLKRRGPTAAIAVALLALGLPLGSPAGAATAFVKTLAGPSVAAMYPSGLEFDASLNRIVTADTGRDRIIFYSPAGTKQGEFGAHGAANGQFSSPRDVAVDAESNIYVADASNNRIQKFGAAGNHLWTVGGTGTCPTCLNTPIGVTWDAFNSVVLVASTGQSLIKAFDTTGAWKWTSPTGPVLGVGSPRDVTRGPDGRLWVSAYKQHQIKAYNVTPAGVWTTAPAIVLGDGVVAGHGDGQLNFPYNVAFSPAGTTVYVSDTGNARIARWTLNGTQATWQTPIGSRCAFPCPSPPADSGKFEQLRRVTTDPAGNIVAADFWGSEVQIFGPTGNVIRQIEGAAAPAPGFAQAFGVAVGADGVTYVVDRLNQRIERFDANGTYQNSAGARGTGPARTSWPEAVAVAPNGDVWLADTRNDRLQRFPANLATVPNVPAFGTSGSGVGQFNYPEGLAVDASGTVWVADTNNHRIQRYVPGTNTFSVFGALGSGPGQLSGPQGVAVSGSALFVADTGNNRIQKLSLTGSFVTQSSVALNGPQGVALAADGTVWVADTGNNRLVHLSADLIDIGDGFGSAGAGNLQFNLPHSLSIRGGDLFVADTYNDRVQVFSIGGSPPPPPVIPSYSSEIAIPGGVAPLYPAGGTADAAGNRYVADSGGSRIVQIAADGTQTTVSAVGWNDPRDIELDTDGSLWALDTSDHEVVHLTTGGAVLATFGGTGKLNQPYGLSVGPASVYVADTYSHRVVSLNKTTGAQQWAQTTCAGKAFKRPRDAGVGSDGNIYVADTDNHRIAVLNAATGGCISAFGTQGTGNSGFKSPRSLTSDGAGGLWVADAMNSRLKHVSNTGTFIGATPIAFGSLNGQFRSPHCVFLDQGQVDVCDTFNYRIQRFSVSASGIPTFSGVLGGVAPAPGAFNGAFGAAYGPGGELYAVDWFNHRINKYNPNGSFSLSWGGYGSPNGSLIFPRAVTVTPDGATVVVTDSENNRIDLFSNTGTFQGSVKPATGTAFLRPHQTALAPDGTYWIADTGNNRALHLGSTGNVLGTIGSLNGPRGIAVDASGVYIANGTGNTVTKYSPAGALLTTLATSGAGATNVKGPYGLHLSGGRLYVADAGNNRVLVLNPAGGAIGSFGTTGSGPGQLSSPRAVAVSPAGAVAVADFVNNRISIWN
jgi:DNA-binding beta-propeller fold protein YncE